MRAFTRIPSSTYSLIPYFRFTRFEPALTNNDDKCKRLQSNKQRRQRRQRPTANNKRTTTTTRRQYRQQMIDQDATDTRDNS